MGPGAAGLLLAAGLILSLAAPAGAETVFHEVSGRFTLEGRYFPQSSIHSGQREHSLSLVAEPEAYLENEAGQGLVFTPFLRYDSADARRTHWDIREAYGLFFGEFEDSEWELRAGIDKVFWGVAESRHLINIVNQTDAIEDVDEEDKFGQPMINLGVQKDWGRIDLFVLPGFRERPFPRTEGRLRAGLIVEEDLASFESGAGNKHIDVAGRYSHFIGDWDFGVSIFHGLSREPRLLPNATGTALAPRYDEITQLGVDVQYTLDAWLWKFEGIAREGHGDSFAAMVGGVEYTFYQVADSDADVGVLAEINLDGRDENRAPPTPLEHDLFLGARLALNDVDDTQALAGAVIDAEARLLGNVDDKNVLAPFKRDSFLNLRLSRFF